MDTAAERALYRQLVEEFTKVYGGASVRVKKLMDEAASKAFGYACGRLDEGITGTYAGTCVNGFSWAYAIHVGRVYAAGGGGIPALQEAWIVYTTNTLGKVVLD